MRIGDVKQSFSPIDVAESQLRWSTTFAFDQGVWDTLAELQAEWDVEDHRHNAAESEMKERRRVVLSALRPYTKEYHAQAQRVPLVEARAAHPEAEAESKAIYEAESAMQGAAFTWLLAESKGDRPATANEVSWSTGCRLDLVYDMLRNVRSGMHRPKEKGNIWSRKYHLCIIYPAGIASYYKARYLVREFDESGFQEAHGSEAFAHRRTRAKR